MVAHHLEFELLPTENAALDEHLRVGRFVQPALNDVLELFTVVRHTAAAAAESERGTNDGGITGALQDVLSLSQGRRNPPLGHGQADANHRFREQLAVFGDGNRLGVGADELNPVPLQRAGHRQRHGDVQGRLSADRR